MIIFLREVVRTVAQAVAIWGSRSHAADPFCDGMMRPW